MADFDRILIVGGGIGGLSLATALHRQGYTPELVERSTAWPAVGAGIDPAWMACGSCGRLASGRPSIGMPQCSAAGDSLISKGTALRDRVIKCFGDRTVSPTIALSLSPA